MERKKIKLGIVGLGVVGNRIIQMIQRHNLSDVLEISAVCDANESLAKEVSESLGRIAWYKDYDKMLEESQIDLVYVAAPPIFHHQMVLKALEKGKHLFCEKPLANSLEEAREMAVAAEKSGLIHGMHFPLNYGPALRHFIQLLSEGYIGDLRRISLTMHFPQWPRPWQQNRWVAGRKQGGFVLEVGVHWIQVIQRVFGQITHVQSKLEYPNNPEKCETGILATMLLHDGTPISIDGFSKIPGDEKLSFTVYGTDGILSIENWGKLMGGKIGEPITEIPSDHMSSMPTVLHHLVAALNGQPAEIYDFTSGYEAQVVLEALRNPESHEMIDIRPYYKEI